MSTLFAPPWYVPVSGAGTTYPGAKLYFYVTGTTTPKDTFSDPDLAPGHAHPNPVEANADGLFPPIYLEAGDYKAILKTSADSTLETVDPLSGLGAADALTARGDLLTRDATGYKRLPIGVNGTVLTSNGVDPSWVAPIVPRGAIQGLTYANNVTDPTNDIDIAIGSAMDATNARMLVLGTALTKKLDATWAVGTNQGGLDTGSIADADYFIWLIYRSDTDVTDVLFSLSATAPTMTGDLASYNYKRLIGWFKRVSTSSATTAASSAAGTATVTYAGSVNFYPVGSSIVVAGVTPAGFNQTAVVTASSPGSVSYANATAGPQTVAGTITGSSIVPFHTYETAGGGLEFQWSAPTTDVDLAATLSTARRTDAVKVPLAFSTVASLNVGVQNGVTPTQILVCCPDRTDLAPGAASTSTAPLSNVSYVTNTNNYAQPVRVRTSAAGLVASRASATVAVYSIVTESFEWSRR